MLRDHRLYLRQRWFRHAGALRQVADDYERNTGRVIVETFRGGRSPEAIPAVLVAGHGPFAWGRDAAQAVDYALMLEQLARVAYAVRMLAPDAKGLEPFLVDKHYLRKHGKDAYYGQAGRET